MATEKVVDKTDNNGDEDDVISIDLPAPQSWIKKFIPKNSGTRRRNEIVFIAPSGEEIKSKRQLDQYLKSHPGGPSASEFEWGTGDTLRRSARLGSKPKARKTPESVPWTKRQKRSSLKKKDVKDETNGEGESAEDEELMKKTENSKDVEMKDAEVAVDHSEQEKANETDVNAKDVEMEDTEVAIDRSEEEKTNETVDATSAKAPVEKTENIDEANKQEENVMESIDVAEECVPDKEEEHEEIKSGTDEEQAEVQVPQQTVPNISKECPDENEPKEYTVHFDAELPEEKPEEGKHAANNAVEERGEITEVPNPNNAVEEKVGEITETATNPMEEQPRETKVASENEIEELLGVTKELLGVTKEAPVEKTEENIDEANKQDNPNNAVEEKVEEITETPNNPMEEQPRETKVASENEIEELLGVTKEAPVEKTEENIDEANKQEENVMESVDVAEECVPDKEEEHEESKLGTDEEQAEVQVPQQTLPNISKECPDENEYTVHFDAELLEEKPEEGKHAANNAVEEQCGEITEVPNPNNAVEEKVGEITETPNNPMEEQPRETKVALENEIEELLGVTKEAPENAIEEQPGVTNVTEECELSKEEEQEEKKLGKDEEQSEVHVTQETVPQEETVHFDAELSEVNNVPEEKPGEEKHAANNETNNAEEQPGKNTEVPYPNNAVEEKAGEITETPNNALGETKNA